MKSRIYPARIIGVLAVAIATLLHVAAQDRNPSKSRLVWAAKPVTPTPFKPPNRLIWRLSEILAAQQGTGELVAAAYQDARLQSRLDLDGARRAKPRPSFSPAVAFSGSSSQGKCG